MLNSTGTAAVWQDLPLLSEGHGSLAKLKKGIDYFQRAHELGDHFGSLNLGWFIERGLVLDKERRARELYEQSAERGNHTAKFNLGNLYEHGIGVEPDRQKAIGLYKEAAAMA